jgi:YVTN family beta-propeller protein
MMRVFVAGASGALGSRLVPHLIDAGHEVIGTHHSPASAELLRTLGAKPVLLDLLDAHAVRKTVLEHGPEAIVHQATALANVKFSRNLDKTLAKTNELRTMGTDALLAAAHQAGVRRFVAQSGAAYGRYARQGGPIKTEDDPVEQDLPTHTHQTAPRWTISNESSRSSAGSRCATASSTAPPTTGRSSRCANGSFRVGPAPYNVAYGFGSLWVAVERALVRLDPATGAIQSRIEVGGRPWGIEIAQSAVWVGNQDNQTISAVDPGTNTVTRRIVLDGAPVGVAVGGGALWAASNSDDRVWRLDPTTGAILGVTHVGDSHEFIGYSEGRVWVASEDGTIGELDAATGHLTKTLAAGSDADYLGFSPGSVWVSNYASPYLWRIDAASGRIAQRLLIGFNAQGVQDDGSRLWVAMYRTGFVYQVDRATGAIRKRFQVGRRPRGLTIALGSVWVANMTSNTISRIRLSR